MTSANVSSFPPLIKADEVYETFNQLSSLINVDSLGQNASTVVDLTKEKPVLLRKGKISLEEILKIWESDER